MSCITVLRQDRNVVVDLILELRVPCADVTARNSVDDQPSRRHYQLDSGQHRRHPSDTNGAGLYADCPSSITISLLGLGRSSSSSSSSSIVTGVQINLVKDCAKPVFLMKITGKEHRLD